MNRRRSQGGNEERLLERGRERETVCGLKGVKCELENCMRGDRNRGLKELRKSILIDSL